MKTTIEVNGYEIVIEETEGMVSVSALKDGETVEEFSLEGDMSEGGDMPESDMPEGEEGISTFDEFEEEEDLTGDMPEEIEEEENEEEDELEEEEDELEEEEDDELEEEEDEEEEENKVSTLESFSSFIKKGKK